MPDTLWSREVDQGEPPASYSAMDVVPYQPAPLNNDSVSEMLEQFRESQKNEADKEAGDDEPDSTNFDFYE